MQINYVYGWVLPLLDVGRRDALRKSGPHNLPKPLQLENEQREKAAFWLRPFCIVLQPRDPLTTR